MTGEHDGMSQGKPSEDYLEFRRMMDSVGHEGVLRMIEHLTAEIEANPHDTEALAARGLAYSELGDHRKAIEDNGRIITLDPDDAGAYLDRARAPIPSWGSTARRWRTTTTPSDGLPAMPWHTTTGGRARLSWAT